MLLRLPVALLILIGCVTVASVVPAEDKPAEAKPAVAPGHSLHGETFDEGPRQRAYLMGSTGAVNFPITTKVPLAQQFFNQGVGQLHGFWYFEAERSFRQAAALDPSCGMAYWGMSLANTNNHSRAKGFIAEAVKRKEGLSERETMFINALDAFFKADANKKKERAEAYAKALERILYKYPDDIEARAMLALQLWLNRSDGLPITSHLAIDALIDQVFRVEPMHPAHHYRIHLWDHEHAENALKSAALCGQAAPGIAHMWHMPGHIYSDVQRYADAAWQQEASARVDHAHMIRDQILPDQIHNFAHNNEWLIRDLSHVGRVRDAVELAKNMIELPRHPKYNTLKKGSSSFGRQRLLENLNRYELWGELLALAQTRYFDATDDEEEQVNRLRHMGRAAFRLGDSTQGQALLAELEQRLKPLSAERDKAGAEAEKKARDEKKDDKQVGEAKAAAIKPFEQRITRLNNAATELQGHLAAMLGDHQAALLSFERASGLDEMSMAVAQLAAGKLEDAEKKAQSSVNGHKNEVRPLAMQVYILWQLGKKDLAKAAFEKLREISTFIDMASPVFTRLTPIAKELGLPEDWRIVKAAPADVGNRPSLDSLGPFRWHPSPAQQWALKDADGVDVTLEQYKGRPVVVIFFLGHGCLHCAQQLQAFAPKTKEFANAGLSIVAVSTDDATALRKSVEAFKPDALPFPLASNPSFEVFKSYRCFDDFEDRPLHGTFVLDAAGQIRWQDIGAEPFMDADFVLNEAQRLLSWDKKPVTTVATQAGGD